MARIDDAQKTLKVLANHSEAILEAHLTRGNRIPETEDNEKLLDTLKHHRLILSIGDEEPQLKKVLAQFLGHITESDRRRWASQHIDKLWEELLDLFEQYRQAKAKVALADQERLEDEIKEILAGLIEDIRISTETFSAYLNSGFSYITDIDLRIDQNRRVIERAQRLLTLFDSFNILELADQAGNDPFLKRLLVKYLPATLEEGRANLAYALNQLRVLLVRLREDQRLNKLVGSFEAYYERNPGFEPSIDHLDLEGCPKVLNNVAPFHVAAAPDIYDPADDSELIELAATARTINAGTTRDDVEVPSVDSVEFDADGEVIEEPEDPVESTVESLIQFILSGDLGDNEIVASDVLANSGLEIDTATWLATVTAEIDSLAVEEYRAIDVLYQSEPDPLYPDNLYIHDLVLREAHGSG
ncbi:hypothetical protein [Marinobacter persicus]|uniref:Uncharacterized protein n=1 Tax=Marinobacter persicus TaxID=930118 RepID=A0A2S6G2A0_9GAMM|nr:hypothetical protein [Marinobacter persicus]PPK49904.1 hypothetical protein BY455_1437 [Marinobacter persicus]PPK51580.1 hypothetical protein B0H24_10447 [Marinobacter persicus]PPK56027.1 hypothetical protein BY454_1447 [Marinobacter persicus]